MSAVAPPERPGLFRYRHGDSPLPGYRILRGVAHGGFGEVYFAVTMGGKEVALKRIAHLPDLETRGVRTILNKPHANLVHTTDLTVCPASETWVVMEFIRGDSLRQIIARNRHGLTDAVILYLMRGLRDGLSHLHRWGIVHRDLKPANVLLHGDCVKIIDFGLAKPATTAVGGDDRSSRHGVAGTLDYMAPEQADGGETQPTSDIYALGVVLFEMVTGATPFASPSSVELRRLHREADVPVDRVREPYRPIIARAMAKKPEDRYQTVEAMFADLEAALGTAEESPAEPRPAPGDRLAASLQRLAAGLEARAGGAAWLVVKYGLLVAVGAMLLVGFGPGRAWGGATVAVLALVGTVGWGLRGIVLARARRERDAVLRGGIPGEAAADDRPTSGGSAVLAARPLTPVSKGSAAVRMTVPHPAEIERAVRGRPWNRLAAALGWVVVPDAGRSVPREERLHRWTDGLCKGFLVCAVAAIVTVGVTRPLAGDDSLRTIWLEVVPRLAQGTWLAVSMTLVTWSLLSLRLLLDEDRRPLLRPATPRRRPRPSRRGPSAGDPSRAAAARPEPADPAPSAAPFWTVLLGDAIVLGLAALVGLISLGLGLTLMVEPFLPTPEGGAWQGVLVALVLGAALVAVLSTRLPLVRLPGEDAGWLPAVFVATLPAALLAAVLPTVGPLVPILVYGAAIAFRLALEEVRPVDERLPPADGGIASTGRSGPDRPTEAGGRSGYGFSGLRGRP